MSGFLKTLLLLPHVRIHNANALPSPYTIGFPAMTAWLGAVHALQRKLNAHNLPVTFPATGVVCHSMNLQTFRGEGDYVSSVIGTGNPLEPKSEKGNPYNAGRPSFIEEARCHLDVTLIVEITNIDVDDHEQLCQQAFHYLNTMKIAGGDILQLNPLQVIKVEDGNSKDMAKLTRKLMPGYALIERRELMTEAMKQGEDALDALLNYLIIYNDCHKDNDTDEVVWSRSRKAPPTKQKGIIKPAGWIIPITIGFQGLTPLGEAVNQRDQETPHCFGEAVVTLGEFKMPYRFTNAEELLWRYYFDKTNHLYLCQQANNTQTTTSDTNMDDSIEAEFA